jgi:hypothetical protein
LNRHFIRLFAGLPFRFRFRLMRAQGGFGGIPPAEPFNEIDSDFFKYTPPKKFFL